ncbi:glycoside hydrolase family 3 protein [Geminicoccus roseus]|uniref:glycoside hydrolase family 3 protein n=1 Tax=Geminicoccus roseus TaxID=404900 RepID=UPI0003FA9F86|nr:glycoside hydrolase family 3 protein [Geminicoccus roseus]
MELVSRLTVEEKVGQIIQADIASITPEDLHRYPLGAILSGGTSAPNHNDYSPAKDWLALADAFYDANRARGGTYVPLLWGTDAVHGHNNIIGATIFPHNIGLGAAHNPELMRRIGEVTATEVQVTGEDWTFAPAVSVARDDHWGRTYESYSEDPELVALYGGAIVEGLQGRPGTPDFLGSDRVLATAKHFLGDGGTFSGKDQGDARISEEELRDLHGPGYVTALQAGAQTVMASYSSWQGIKMHGNPALLTDVLKGRMSFQGFVVGDWNGHAQVPGCSKESCPQAIIAGLDMFMAPDKWKELYANTLAQVQAGEIPMARLDDAVGRILRVKMRAGMFERPRPSERPLAGRYELLGAPEHLEVARQAVRESLVLLKNDRKVLPLAPNQRVLVAGNGADSIPKLAGGWSVTWQGTNIANHNFPNGQSIFAGISEAVGAGGGSVELSVDGSFTTRPDVAVVVFGEEPYAETKGDRETTAYHAMHGADLELLQRLKEQDVKIVSIFLSGRPLYTTPEINVSDAFVAAWLPGTQGGGVADLLFARPDGSIAHDFRGRLSFSWPKYPDQIVNRNDADYDPLFPYGYGLTYAEARELGQLPES